MNQRQHTLFYWTCWAFPWYKPPMSCSASYQARMWDFWEGLATEMRWTYTSSDPCTASQALTSPGISRQSLSPSYPSGPVGKKWKIDMNIFNLKQMKWSWKIDMMKVWSHGIYWYDEVGRKVSHILINENSIPKGVLFRYKNETDKGEVIWVLSLSLLYDWMEVKKST